MDIVNIAKRRYTTKSYNPNKKIPEESFEQLCEVLRYAPSSVNSQPWHFIVVKTDEAKNKIMDGIMDFNQDRVRNASHVIIFCARMPFSSEHLDNVLEQEDKDGRYADEETKKAQDKGRRFFTNLNSKTEESLLAWESDQIYISLGMLLYSAAALDIDSTPLEGIDIGKLNEILNLKEKGLTAVVAASLGYHAEDDFNASLAKSRLPKESIFSEL